MPSLDEKRDLVRAFYMIAETMSSRADAEIVRTFASELERQLSEHPARPRLRANVRP